ncbi:hypothetical protein GCM10007940_45120 [Portibacter lacus]|uniref:Cupin type-2 domain-containing protein n=2 Tax=Portibacter lacus TaxID=1099794 RepID=A0AA37SVY9_9BACT|nr:hypothetical protein GCM10007940_45120 [Portibacter lacus]
MLNLLAIQAQEKYKKGPNSWSFEGIPKGVVTQHEWKSSLFSNTIRDYYVYVPAQYDGSQPAALMVFQDGHTYVKKDGDFDVATVFDNLISQEKMPVTIGLFINPGHDMDAAEIESPWRASNRSVEYDEMSDKYARFLIEEMIPELEKKYKISADPKMRAIGGISSGGICAFSAAWYHPESFHKVLSHIGSFTNIRGGHNYPSMIRKTDKKDIKVFLQDGSGDLNNEHGNWWLANQQMDSALDYKGYEYTFVTGSEGHNGKHGGAILPESLIWLWSDMVEPKVASGIYHSTPNGKMMSGASMHFSDMNFGTKSIASTQGAIDIYDKVNEQILIIKEGEISAKLYGEKKIIGPNSVLFLLPGTNSIIESVSDQAQYYTMVYQSRETPDVSRGKETGSFIKDFEEIEFKEHNKGGVRNYFHTSTTMCPYYEMHMTNLNPGIKSHEPHTHRASEILLMIKGTTEMEIGNQLYRGKAGDAYFLPGNIPHAIRNTGKEQAMYFAFQWY